MPISTLTLSLLSSMVTIDQLRQSETMQNLIDYFFDAKRHKESFSAEALEVFHNELNYVPVEIESKKALASKIAALDSLIRHYPHIVQSEYGKAVTSHVNANQQANQQDLMAVIAHTQEHTAERKAFYDTLLKIKKSLDEPTPEFGLTHLNDILKTAKDTYMTSLNAKQKEEIENLGADPAPELLDPLKKVHTEQLDKITKATDELTTELKNAAQRQEAHSLAVQKLINDSEENQKLAYALMQDKRQQQDPNNPVNLSAVIGQNGKKIVIQGLTLDDFTQDNIDRLNKKYPDNDYRLESSGAKRRLEMKKDSKTGNISISIQLPGVLDILAGSAPAPWYNIHPYYSEEDAMDLCFKLKMACAGQENKVLKLTIQAESDPKAEEEAAINYYCAAIKNRFKEKDIEMIVGGRRYKHKNIHELFNKESHKAKILEAHEYVKKDIAKERELEDKRASLPPGEHYSSKAKHILDSYKQDPGIIADQLQI